MMGKKINWACSSFACVLSTANTPTPNYRRHSSACLLLLYPVQLVCNRYSAHIRILRLQCVVRKWFFFVTNTVAYCIYVVTLVIHSGNVLFAHKWISFLFFTNNLTNLSLSHFLFLPSGTGSFRPIQTRLAPSSRPPLSKTSPAAASSAAASQLSSMYFFIFY